MRHIDTVVIHHSASATEALTWDRIGEIHMAPKPRGNGFSSIGYHYGIVDDGLTWGLRIGRPIESIGAHAAGANVGSIGVMFEGNYSETELPEEAFWLGVIWVSALMREYDVTAQRLLPHRGAGTTQTECPGTKFPWDRFVRTVKVRL